MAVRRINQMLSENLPAEPDQEKFLTLNGEIKDVENSMRNLNMKNRQELKDLFQNPRDHLTAYELTDENLQAFRKLRKFCFSFTVYKNDF